MSNGNYDLIIIGSGAGGVLLVALKLASSGKRILLLERGGFLRARSRIGPNRGV